MDRNEIIKMALEAGMEQDGDNFFSPCHEEIDVHIADLERFAALVSAAERERIIAANAPEIEKTNSHIKALEDAIAAQQKACMELENEIAKSPAFFATMAEWHAYREGVQEIILAIRARGNT